MAGDTAPSAKPLHESLAALRLEVNSDLNNIHAFILNTLERGREGVKPVGAAMSRSLATSSDQDGSTTCVAESVTNGSSPPKRKLRTPIISFSSMEKFMTPSTSPVSSCDSPSNSPAFEMPHSSRRSPHWPRSALQKLIPERVAQREGMEMAMLQAQTRRGELQRLAWNGCSVGTRAPAWRMLLRCEPLAYAERDAGLAERRTQYAKLQRIMGGPGVGCCCEDVRERTEFGVSMLRQIDMDLPRTHPTLPLFHVERVRSAMRRVLYLFAVVHPECGYVQGMNEVLTPLMTVFLLEQAAAAAAAAAASAGGKSPARSVDAFLLLDSLEGVVDEAGAAAAEADSYWCFVELVSGVFDNYTAEQPGMHRRMGELWTLLGKVDGPLAAHLVAEECEPMQFAFRWVAVVMLREFRLPLVVHLWDGLLGQRDGFGSFLVYVAAALVVNWRDELLAMEFADMIVLLLHLPTAGWGACDIDFLLAQAQAWAGEHSLE